MCADVASRAVIRSYRPEDRDAIGDIAVAAWTPIYAHLAQLQAEALGGVVRPLSLETKRSSVHHYADEHPDKVIVTEVDGVVVGFLTYYIDVERHTGTIGNNGVAPQYAGRGIGSAQYRHVLDLFRAAGMTVATVVTGLDDSHAAARRAYEKVGFVQVTPSVEYMQKL